MPQAFYMPRQPVGAGQLYCRLHRPAAGVAPRGALVYVHPWCEEMNKSRRMAALQARRLADSGWAVLQVDLLGCGDSSGDFGDADWGAWTEDVVMAARWLRARFDGPLWLWGLRAGCLLAADAAARLDAPSRFLFWQPATSGKVVLQQFLMLRIASQMKDGKAQGQMQALREELATGKAVHIGGYTLSPTLAEGMAAAALRPPPRGGRGIWLEVLAQSGAPPAPALVQAQSQWAEAGTTVRLACAAGPAFWQTTEVEDAPALIAATTELLLEEPES